MDSLPGFEALKEDFAIRERRFPDGSCQVLVRKRFRDSISTVEPPTRARHRESPREDNRGRATRRARQQIKLRCRAINANHLVTLTYRENMQDLDRLLADWTAFLREFRGARLQKAWSYVATRERQERGAWHVHIAVHGRQDVHSLRAAWLAVVLDGGVHVKGPENRWRDLTQHGRGWTSRKLAAYIAKYVGKDVDQDAQAGRRSYWASKAVDVQELRSVYTGTDVYGLIDHVLFWVVGGDRLAGVVHWNDKPFLTWTLDVP